MNASRERVATVTGIDVIAPNGIGLREFWSATLAGHSGIRPISRFDASSYPVRLAGEIQGFEAADHVPSRLVAQTDRMTHLALATAERALDDAGVRLTDLGEFDASVVTANSSGGFEFGQRELEKLWTKGSAYVGAYQSIAWFYAASTGQISIRHKLRGQSGVLAAEQAGAIDAVGQARRVIRAGSRIVVTGGTDATLCPWGFVTQLPGQRLTRCADPRRAYRPFAPGASGFVPGEGGAILILEDEAQARARGAAHRYGQIAGYGATFDPPPGSGRPPRLRAAIELALADAQVTPADVDVVFADALGLPGPDAEESATIAAVFGPYAVPVTAPKTMTGRLYAGSAVDIATALLCIRDGVIPPTVAVDEVAPAHQIDLVLGQPREAPVRTALVIARGFGGFNSALVVTK